jgi:hypothetical protein
MSSVRGVCSCSSSTGSGWQEKQQRTYEALQAYTPCLQQCHLAASQLTRQHVIRQAGAIHAMLTLHCCWLQACLLRPCHQLCDLPNAHHGRGRSNSSHRGAQQHSKQREQQCCKPKLFRGGSAEPGSSRSCHGVSKAGATLPQAVVLPQQQLLPPASDEHCSQ